MNLELTRAEFGQSGNIAGSSEPEAEVLSNNDPRGMQWSEHGIDELSRAPAGDLGGEVNDDDVIDTRLALQFLTPLQ